MTDRMRTAAGDDMEKGKTDKGGQGAKADSREKHPGNRSADAQSARQLMR